jgi:2,3-dihydroxybenzoate-AMP ligase
MLDGCTPFPPEFRRRYIREGYWKSETIGDALTAALRARDSAVAVTDGRRAPRARELVAEAAGFAALLRQSGIGAGDRIVFQLPNCAEFASLLLACAQIGALPVMALAAFRRSEIAYLIAFSGAKAIAIAPRYRGFDYAAMACELRQDYPVLETILATEPAPGCIHFAGHSDAADTGAYRGDPFDVALFLLSGGTTGMPKLIPRTHADYLYNARAAAEACALDSSARILLALPIGHNFPLACPGLLGAILTGARAVLSGATAAPDLAAAIERESITHLPCVPTIAMALADLPEGAERAMRSMRRASIHGSTAWMSASTAMVSARSGGHPGGVS